MEALSRAKKGRLISSSSGSRHITSQTSACVALLSPQRKGAARNGSVQHTFISSGNSSHQLYQDLDNPHNLASLIRLFSKSKSLSAGKLLHSYIITSGYAHNSFLANCLVGFYGSCGSLQDAHSVFDSLPSPSVFAWNMLLHAYGEHTSLSEARVLFEKIPHPDVCSWNTLIKLVSQHGCLDSTRTIFNSMPHRNIVSWNAMIAASARPMEPRGDALYYFLQMQVEGIQHDKFTFISVIDSCTSLKSVDTGKMVHVLTLSTDSENNAMVGSALVNMYGKCGKTSEALGVFQRMMPCQDTITWTAMMTAFAHNEHGKEALDLLYRMAKEGIKTDKITYVCALDGCAILGAFLEGQEIHSVVVELELERNPVIGSALVNMYGKCGSLSDANSIFYKLSHRDAVSWTVMIGAFVQNQEHERALHFFNRMHSEGFSADEITYVCVLDACAGLANLEQGHLIYSAIFDQASEHDIVIGNNLVNLFGKCGCLLDSRIVFDSMPCKTILTWNTMLGACALNGQSRETILLFEKLKAEGGKADDVTYLCVLNACSHEGLLEYGRYIFLSVILDGKLDPTRDHCVSAVDLLARAGQLDEAEALIHSIPLAHFPMLWLCLLGACKTHGDVERGVRAADRCFNLDPTNASPCVAMLNLYSEASKFVDAEEYMDPDASDLSVEWSSQLPI